MSRIEMRCLDCDEELTAANGLSCRCTTADEDVIEIAQALEQRRALTIVETVASLPIGGAAEIAPSAFQAGYQQACDEIAHRLRTEVWPMCLSPIDAPKRIDAGPSPESTVPAH